jgi:zinc transport system substrate-binding protein
MKLKNIFYLVFFLSILLHSSLYSQKYSQKSKIEVVVTVLPIANFVQSVGGDKVNVTTLIESGQNPHAYSPKPGQLKKLAEADLYVKVGTRIEFESAWLDKIKKINKDLVICDSSSGLKFISIDKKHSHHDEFVDEAADDDVFHSGYYDPHVWTSPKNAILMIENIQKAFSRYDPLNKDYYRANSKKFITDIQAMIMKMNKSLARIKNKRFMSYHPAWSYLARDFGLEEVAIESENRDPSSRELVNLIKFARQENINIIFISPQFNRKSADVLAKAINGRVVMLDPLEKNYLFNLNKFMVLIGAELE